MRRSTFERETIRWRSDWRREPAPAAVTSPELASSQGPPPPESRVFSTFDWTRSAPFDRTVRFTTGAREACACGSLTRRACHLIRAVHPDSSRERAAVTVNFSQRLRKTSRCSMMSRAEPGSDGSLSWDRGHGSDPVDSSRSSCWLTSPESPLITTERPIRTIPVDCRPGLRYLICATTRTYLHFVAKGDAGALEPRRCRLVDRPPSSLLVMVSVLLACVTLTTFVASP